MSLLSPKAQTTRLQVPVTLEGQEPANAMPGTLAFATDTDTLRVQTSTGWQDVSSGSGSSAYNSEGIYAALPSSPNAWDDEFTSGSPDLAARGWSIFQLRPAYAPMSRIGDIDFTINPTAMAAGTYRSSIRGGRLCIQIGGPASSEVHIQKASSGNYTYSTLVTRSSNLTDSQAWVIIADFDSAVAGKYGRVGAYGDRVRFGSVSGATATAIFDTLLNVHYFMVPTVLSLGWVQGTTTMRCLISLGAFQQANQTGVFAYNPFTPTYAGISLLSANLTGHFYEIDYIRRTLGAPFM